EVSPNFIASQNFYRTAIIQYKSPFLISPLPSATIPGALFSGVSLSMEDCDLNHSKYVWLM
ncbi:hypothetical protein, partial [Phocaeicola plebeius]|uniref:hypothetical protein n=1 Tax=Phocaeicola plebeius TaxID=310297 RepID=UPI0030794090